MLGLGLVLGLGVLGVPRAFADDEPASRPGVELITAQVRALPSATLAPAQAGELSLLLLEAPDRELPLALRVEASALELVENRLGWAAVVDPLALQPRLRVAFTAPREPGRYEVHAQVEYFVCDQRWCRSKRGELRWDVLVAPADELPEGP